MGLLCADTGEKLLNHDGNHNGFDGVGAQEHQCAFDGIDFTGLAVVGRVGQGNNPSADGRVLADEVCNVFKRRRMILAQVEQPKQYLRQGR